MSIGKYYVFATILILAWLALEPTIHSRVELGSKSRPIIICLTPSVDAGKVTNSAELLVSFLQKETGLHFSSNIPSNFIAVVEAFGSDRADIAAMNTFGYILLHKKYGATAALKVVRRDGELTYRGQFVARANSGIDSLQDIAGKTIAYVDAASTSGYILPKALLQKRNIKPSTEVFGMKHDNVITMVYQGQVDVGCTYYSPPDKASGEIMDARARVKKQFPDVFDKIKIVAFTEPIPNDPVVFRKDFPPILRELVLKALLKFQSTPEGKKALFDIYNVEGFIPTTDSDYDKLRTLIERFGGDLQKALQKK